MGAQFSRAPNLGHCLPLCLVWSIAKHWLNVTEESTVLLLSVLVSSLGQAGLPVSTFFLEAALSESAHSQFVSEFGITHCSGNLYNLYFEPNSIPVPFAIWNLPSVSPSLSPFPPYVPLSSLSLFFLFHRV